MHDVDKKEKLKVNSIQIEGNEALTDNQLKWAMKKTNEKGKIRNIFRAKKFVEDLYEADKKNVLTKYQEKGYRDAEILRDTVYKYDDKTVNIDWRITAEQQLISEKDLNAISFLELPEIIL